MNCAELTCSERRKLLHCVDGAVDLRLADHQARPVGQGVEHLGQRAVERGREALEAAEVALDAHHPALAADEVHHAAVFHQHALRPAGRARRVNDVGQLFRPDLPRRPLVGQLADWATASSKPIDVGTGSVARGSVSPRLSLASRRDATTWRPFVATACLFADEHQDRLRVVEHEAGVAGPADRDPAGDRPRRTSSPPASPSPDRAIAPCRRRPAARPRRPDAAASAPIGSPAGRFPRSV